MITISAVLLRSLFLVTVHHYFYVRSPCTRPASLGNWNHWITNYTAATMAHLPPIVIEQRRSLLYQELLALWQPLQGQELYVIMCPCDSNPCGHMPEDQFPRLRIDKCYYPGELDYFMVKEPFMQQHKFRVTWICSKCFLAKHPGWFSCGAPGHAALGNQA